MSAQTAEAVLTELIARPDAVTGPLRAHGPVATRRRWTRALVLPAILGVALVVAAIFMPVPVWVWPVWVVLTVCCALLAADRSRSLGHRVDAGWLVARAGSLERRRDCIAAAGIIGWTVRQTFLQRRAGVATLIAAAAAGLKSYQVIDVPAELAWTIAATASPWVADNEWVTCGRARLALKYPPFSRHHGCRWGAVRHRWRPGDLVETHPRRGRDAASAGGQPDCALVSDQHHHPHRVQIAELLTDAGMAVTADEVITAAVLTAEYVRSRYPDARCFLVNSGQIAEDMPGINIVYSSEFDDGTVPYTPDVVLLGGAGSEYNHLTLSRVYDWMAQGVPVVAMHRSTSWNTTEGLRIDTGMYLIGMEETSAARPPPSASLRRKGSSPREPIGVDPDEMYMIGDDLNNDVLAAQVTGMIGVLVRTGKFRQDTLDRWAADEFAMQPNHVIDSVADLPELLRALAVR